MAKKEVTAKELARKDIEKYSALEAVKNSEGGQIILSSLKKDIVAAIDEICSKFKNSPAEDLIAPAAKLAERLMIYRTLMRSSTNKQDAIEELTEILQEDPDLE